MEKVSGKYLVWSEIPWFYASNSKLDSLCWDDINNCLKNYENNKSTIFKRDQDVSMSHLKNNEFIKHLYGKSLVSQVDLNKWSKRASMYNSESEFQTR